jgi:hypothetical protein
MNARPVRSFAVSAVVTAFALGSFSSVHASLIVYEGFNYGPSASLLAGLGNTTEVGMQGTWTNNGSAGTTVDYSPAGLTFSDLIVTGGLAQMNGVIAGTGDRTAAVGRRLNVSAQSGTLWGSYLFRPMSDAAARSVGSLLQGGAANVSDNTAFFSLANNEFNQSVGGVRISAGSGGNAALATGGVVPSLNTTYLYVFRLDNIAAPSASTQSATAWMLSEAQFDNFKLGGFDEAELNAATIGSLGTDVMQRVSLTTTNGLTLPGTFDDTDFLRLFNFSGGEFVTQYDEIKFSNGNLNEAVLPIPEPSAWLTVAGGMGMLLGVRRLRPKC